MARTLSKPLRARCYISGCAQCRPDLVFERTKLSVHSGGERRQLFRFWRVLYRCMEASLGIVASVAAHAAHLGLIRSAASVDVRPYRLAHWRLCTVTGLPNNREAAVPEGLLRVNTGRLAAVTRFT